MNNKTALLTDITLYNKIDKVDASDIKNIHILNSYGI